MKMAKMIGKVVVGLPKDEMISSWPCIEVQFSNPCDKLSSAALMIVVIKDFAVRMWDQYDGTKTKQARKTDKKEARKQGRKTDKKTRTRGSLFIFVAKIMALRLYFIIIALRLYCIIIAPCNEIVVSKTLIIVPNI